MGGTHLNHGSLQIPGFCYQGEFLPLVASNLQISRPATTSVVWEVCKGYGTSQNCRLALQEVAFDWHQEAFENFEPYTSLGCISLSASILLLPSVQTSYNQIPRGDLF